MKKQCPLEFKSFYKRKLPHIQPVGAVFFITYRIDFEYTDDVKDYLNSKSAEFAWKVLRTSKEKRHKKIEDFNKMLFDFEDNFLSKIQSPNWLFDEDIANIISRSLFFRNKIEYDLLCSTIMPNHVHILIKPLNISESVPYSLSRIMHNHKRYTARECNKLLKRNGNFWFPDYYDHYLRDENELHSVVNYILYNPVKAGFVDDWKDWKHSWVDEDFISL